MCPLIWNCSLRIVSTLCTCDWPVCFKSLIPLDADPAVPVCVALRVQLPGSTTDFTIDDHVADYIALERDLDRLAAVRAVDDLEIELLVDGHHALLSVES